MFLVRHSAFSVSFKCEHASAGAKTVEVGTKTAWTQNECGERNYSVAEQAMWRIFHRANADGVMNKTFTVHAICVHRAERKLHPQIVELDATFRHCQTVSPLRRHLFCGAVFQFSQRISRHSARWLNFSQKCLCWDATKIFNWNKNRNEVARAIEGEMELRTYESNIRWIPREFIFLGPTL